MIDVIGGINTCMGDFGARFLYSQYNLNVLYCHVYQWLKTGFGFIIGFIAYLQVVTTNNYNTVTDLHTTKHSTLISSVYLH
jgi:hypothetical protein